MDDRSLYSRHHLVYHRERRRLLEPTEKLTLREARVKGQEAVETTRMYSSLQVKPR